MTEVAASVVKSIPPTSSTATTAPRRIAAPPFTISNITKQQQWLKLLVYGKPGAGKTTLLASAAGIPEMNDIFMINAESGDMVFYDNPLINEPENIDMATPNNYKMVVKMYEFLSAHHRYRDILLRDPKRETPDGVNAFEKLCLFESSLKGLDVDEVKKTGPKLYRTIIVDSLSEVERMAMDNFLGAGDQPGVIDISDDVKVAEFKEYKQINNTLNRVMRALRDLPYHLLVVCSADWTQNEHKQSIWKPAMTGKLSTQVQGYFDLVGYLVPGRQGDVTIRRLWIAPEGKWDAKCRRAAITESYFDNPTMQTIMVECGLLKKAKKSK